MDCGPRSRLALRGNKSNDDLDRSLSRSLERRTSVGDEDSAFRGRGVGVYNLLLLLLPMDACDAEPLRMDEGIDPEPVDEPSGEVGGRGPTLLLLLFFPSNLNAEFKLSCDPSLLPLLRRRRGGVEAVRPIMGRLGCCCCGCLVVMEEVKEECASVTDAERLDSFGRGDASSLEGTTVELPAEGEGVVLLLVSLLGLRRAARSGSRSSISRLTLPV